jgi:ankyrin repeat protein
MIHCIFRFSFHAKSIKRVSKPTLHVNTNLFFINMGQSQSSKFDKLFTLICTDNIEELRRQLRSCSSPEQTTNLSNLTDNDKGATLLMYAAFYGNQSICQLLIESGADVFFRDNEGRHVLYYAIVSQAHNVVKYLIENVLINADPNIQHSFLHNKDHTGETCLHEAVKVHAVAGIELLLKHDVDVNIVNNDGITALHRAVDLGKSKI